MRVEMKFSTPDTHENEWQLILEAKVDDAMAGRGFRRSGPVNWELPPWNHYLNGKSAPPGYVEVSFEAELTPTESSPLGEQARPSPPRSPGAGLGRATFDTEERNR